MPGEHFKHIPYLRDTALYQVHAYASAFTARHGGHMTFMHQPVYQQYLFFFVFAHQPFICKNVENFCCPASGYAVRVTAAPVFAVCIVITAWAGYQRSIILSFMHCIAVMADYLASIQSFAGITRLFAPCIKRVADIIKQI